MADILEDGPGLAAVEALGIAINAAAEQAGDPLEGLIVITVTRDGITVTGRGDEDLDHETQAAVLCALAEAFGCKVDVEVAEAGAVH